MRELTIGRLSHNDIVIEDDSVSRNHATLLISGDDFSIKDIGSSNGTFINGMRVNGVSKLNKNDILKVGNELVPWMNYIAISDVTDKKIFEEDQNVSGREAATNQKQKIPNSSGALTLGILGLLFSLGLFGIIFSILAISLGAGGVSRYKADPQKYTEGSFSNAKAGKAMGIIGLGLFGLGIIVLIVIIAVNS
jgi:hypothetical protein